MSRFEFEKTLHSCNTYVITCIYCNMENLFDTENLFSEINEADKQNNAKLEVVEAEVKYNYIAEVPDSWQVRRFKQGAISNVFEVLDTYRYEPKTQTTFRETAIKRGKLLGNNTVVELFKKVYVCEETNQLKAHKGERVIGVNGDKEVQKCTVYKKFNGRRN